MTQVTEQALREAETLRELDDIIQLEAGDFVVLGGYPSAGKTALALQIARSMACQYHVGFYSLETNQTKAARRILAATADESDPSYSSVVSLLNGYMPLMIDLVRSDRGTLFLPSPSHPPDFFIHQRGAASDEFGHLGGVFDEISADPSQTSPVIVASASLVTKKMYCMDALLSICTVFSFFSFF